MVEVVTLTFLENNVADVSTMFYTNNADVSQMDVLKGKKG
jgi:hypothetical protein